MREPQVANRPVSRWLPVVDSSGRTRMEAVWIVVPAAATAAVAHAA